MTGLPDDVTVIPYVPADHDAPRGSDADCQGFDDGTDSPLPDTLRAHLARLDEDRHEGDA